MPQRFKFMEENAGALERTVGCAATPRQTSNKRFRPTLDNFPG